jgi:hypothetical protein
MRVRRTIRMTGKERMNRMIVKMKEKKGRGQGQEVRGEECK